MENNSQKKLTVFEKRLLEFKSIKSIKSPSFSFVLAKVFVVFLISSLTFLIFVPWLQTAQGTGSVISVNPDNRVQNISAFVSGRIKKWYVGEGSEVKKGDKILEIVDNDSELIGRLQSDVDNIEINLQATTIAKENTLKNYQRQKDLNRLGLSSQRDVEQSRIQYQGFVSKLSEVKNTLNDAQKELSRQQRQIIYAPEDGTIINIVAGNEATAVSSGQKLASFIPSDIDFAVELFINGIDTPLVYKGRKVRLEFEGWPIVQFTGWPSKAVGTFGGVVASVDQAVSDNGKFRVIIVPNPEDDAWPGQRYLRYGAQANGWILLEEVSVGYEIWRKINSFPPKISHDYGTAKKK
ncbi:MAG: multidrug efflux pump subunit AcrA (membrane-fusion protein) [Rickettsiales bacterium]|jgi:multidrug efflux pump subunit AcrA (membrane-fusion protein)